MKNLGAIWAGQTLAITHAWLWDMPMALVTRITTATVAEEIIAGVISSKTSVTGFEIVYT